MKILSPFQDKRERTAGNAAILQNILAAAVDSNNPGWSFNNIAKILQK